MPFTDPMADGPAIQAAGLRALKAGQDMKKTLALVRDFRAGDDDDADRADGLLQSDLHLRRRTISRRCQGRRRRRADRRRSAARGRRRTVPAGAQGGLQFHPARDADHRRQAPAGGARRTRRASSTTSRSPASPAPPRPMPARSPTAVARIKRHTKLAGLRRLRRARPPSRRARSREGADGVVVGSALVEAVRQSLGPDGQGDRRDRRGRDRSRRARSPRACAARVGAEGIEMRIASSK